jgi:hypothetical protein
MRQPPKPIDTMHSLEPGDDARVIPVARAIAMRGHYLGIGRACPVVSASSLCCTAIAGVAVVDTLSSVRERLWVLMGLESLVASRDRQIVDQDVDTGKWGLVG